MASNDRNAGLLSPYRVFDLTDELGFLCGKILGDLGADVIKIERPGGDPARSLGPFYGNQPDPEKSLYWFGFNNNKRGITLNLESGKGREIFRRLAAKADFVIETFTPGYLDGLNLGYAELSRINPRLVLTSITPFGQTGPYSKFKASDIEIMALSGCMSLTGDPDQPPLRVSFPQSYGWTGSYGAMGALTAHYYREETGEGQQVDVSAQACLLWAFSHAHTFWDLNRHLEKRAGSFMTGRSITGAKMRVFWPCKDGYLNFIIYGGEAGRRTNQALVEWMDSKGMAPEFLKQKDWKRFDIAQVTQEEIDRMEEPIGHFFAGITKAEFFKEVVKREMLGYPVASVKEIFEDPQHRSRNFWQKIEHPELKTAIDYPGAFAKFSEGACRIWRRAPLIGEHNEEIYRRELGLSTAEITELSEQGVI
ncbi:MAG TPA: CoA transferase [Candidatus Udaeobacter sp.]|jgi:crotonobetainyl-CoA:carnitine CoA-transferase CaiB-like acyl-CoA transferase|nr:CoA transferase [Candidatus Udaeobacter sp.]